MTESPWSEYYKNTLDKEPNRTAIIAEKQYKDKTNKLVLDIGSGTGCDSLYFLEQGFRVKALDQETNALEILRRKLTKEYEKKITLEHIKIQNYSIPENTYDIINASFSLPFCNKRDFENVWENIHGGLKTGGIFSGQLFGIHDGWVGITDMSFVSNDEVNLLIKKFKVKYFEEIDEDGRIADESVKHWHLFNLVLIKK